MMPAASVSVFSASYTRVSARYTHKEYTGEEVLLAVGDLTQGAAAGKLTAETRDYPHGDRVLDLKVDDTVDLTISVPQDGLYRLAFDYLSYDESVLPIEFAMQIDGEYPFYESRNVALNVTWAPKAEPAYDRYGATVNVETTFVGADGTAMTSSAVITTSLTADAPCYVFVGGEAAYIELLSVN